MSKQFLIYKLLNLFDVSIPTSVLCAPLLVFLSFCWTIARHSLYAWKHGKNWWNNCVSFSLEIVQSVSASTGFCVVFIAVLSGVYHCHKGRERSDAARPFCEPALHLMNMKFSNYLKALWKQLENDKICEFRWSNGRTVTLIFSLHLDRHRFL